MIVWALFMAAFAVGSAEAEDAPEPRLACPQPGGLPPVAHTLSDAPDDQLRALRAEVFLDQTGTVGPDSVTGQPFHPQSCTGVFKAPMPSQSLWLRFAVANPHADRKIWVVSFIEEIFDEVVLFEDQGGTLAEVSRAGRTIRPEAQDSTRMQIELPIEMQPGAERLFYLRITGTFEPTVTAVIMSAELFDDWTTVLLLIAVLFLAYILTVALLSVILFRQINLRFYKYYTLYLLCLFMFTFIYDGWLSRLFGVTLPATTLTPITQGFSGLGILAIVQYCRVLLNVDADVRAVRRLFQLLSVATITVTGLAMLDPWRLAMPLHLTYFVSPLILLAVAARKIGAGLPQAWPVAGSLLVLSGGLSVAVYSFLVPVGITEASSAFDVVLARPLSLGYIAAIVGETLFMMLAISTMVRTMQTERQSAAMEVATLDQRVRDIEHLQGKTEKTTRARLEALEAALADDPEGKQHLPVRHQFLDRATDSILDSIGDQSFGVEKLADALAVSQKTLGRRLKQVNGQSPASFIRSVRLNYARNLILLDQHNTVAEIAHAAGFSSVSNFAKLYRQQFGETPSQSIGMLRKVQ